MGLGEGCLSAIFIEFSFWLIAGIISLVLYKFVDSVVMFVLAFIVLLIAAHFYERSYAAYRCVSCGNEYTKKEASEHQVKHKP